MNTTVTPRRPRNPFTALSRLRGGAGRHAASGKAVRQAARRALAHELTTHHAAAERRSP